jgi:AGCS family alanine or glycine:cation symporter
VLILGVGLYLSLRTGFAQLRLLPAACREFWHRLFSKSRSCDGVSSFQALCTALAATVGTGNIVGVAGALCIGGPGAIFWMWISALFGMVTKMAEATLAVRYRVRQGEEYLGGPMYYIRHGLGKKWAWMGGVYAFFGVVATFGVGNATQVNAVILSINSCITAFGGEPSHRLDLILGIGLAVIVLAMLLGGAKRIGAVAERLVPFAAALYLLLGVVVLTLRVEAVPIAFASIFRGAFSPQAATGGVVGYFLLSLRTGVSRGVFTNEAGMGTAAMAHGSAVVRHPVQQGLMGIMEVFLDTIVICTMTALVILCSGIDIPYGIEVPELTSYAYSAVLGNWVQVVIAVSLCLFAFATILGWGLYGARCAQYLFGHGVWKKFAWLQAATVILGAVLQTSTVWLLAETVNGLMAIPNLIALFLLSPEICRLIKQYQGLFGRKANGGTYEDLDQCQPLRTVPHAEIPSHGGAG